MQGLMEGEDWDCGLLEGELFTVAKQTQEVMVQVQRPLSAMAAV